MFLWIALEVLIDRDEGALLEAPFPGSVRAHDRVVPRVRQIHDGACEG